MGNLHQSNEGVLDYNVLKEKNVEKVREILEELSTDLQKDVESVVRDLEKSDGAIIAEVEVGTFDLLFYFNLICDWCGRKLKDMVLGNRRKKIYALAYFLPFFTADGLYETWDGISIWNLKDLLCEDCAVNLSQKIDVFFVDRKISSLQEYVNRYYSLY